ncbi:DNA primase [Pseudidiomarina gelatinasegens]|uniref:DNA primase n=1 Tax=Pseudidiomarina gelatinasegens TaxID=2487740 RepID=A0A443YYB8_9GAMM|nr:DNA primase [Pseudidiomarina gelatinasegens]RWU09055.1 DNA primase [Pseudidiomarina gelatinasegens]
MAGLIPKSFIHDLLERADVVEVVDSRVPLKKAGRNYQACCPFHNEKSPSFTVAPDKQFYHCFGCGEHGNAIDFLMKFDGLEFPEAIEELAHMMGLEVPRETTADPAADAKKRAQESSDYEQMERAAKFFAHQLRRHENSAAVIDYLKGRGLSGEIVKQFQIGYAPDAWDGLLSALAKDQRSKDQLVDLKLINRNEQGRYYDFFRDRVMFPIRDRRGRVVGFGGRILDGDGPKYLNSPETRIFHKGRELYGFYEARQANRELEQVVIVEGYMDVVALAQAGISYAVASLGTATTTDQLQMLFRATRRVVCCYDGDRAGRDAAWRALENALPLLNDGVELSFLFLPDGEDPDTLVRKIGADEFRKRLDKAQSFTDYFFAHLTDTIDVNSDSGKSLLLKQAKPLIERVGSEFYRDTLMERLARLLRREASQLAAQIKAPATQKAPQDSLKMTPMRRAIGLLVQHPQLGREIPLHSELSALKQPGIQLLLKLHEQTQAQELTSAQLLELWRGEPEEKPLRQLARWQHHLDSEKVTQEFFDIFAYFIDQFVEQRANELLEKERTAPLNKVEKQEYLTLLQYLKDRGKR